MNYFDFIDTKDRLAYIHNYLAEQFFLAMTECLQDNNIKAYYTLYTYDPSVTFNTYYSYEYNKAFVEVRLNGLFKNTFKDDLVQIKSIFDNNINNNFKINTWTYYERIMPEDNENTICDSSPITTPYTINFWKSLTGRYEFLEDEVNVLKDCNDASFPKYPDEYYTEAKSISDQYYLSDFNTFVEKMYELNTRYNTQPFTPDNIFLDFVEEVKEINKRYSQVQLSDEDKQQFIFDYMDILTNYHGAELRAKRDELYEEYGIIKNIQRKVPEMFDEYKEKYLEYFGVQLNNLDIHNHDSVLKSWIGGEKQIFNNIDNEYKNAVLSATYRIVCEEE